MQWADRSGNVQQAGRSGDMQQAGRSGDMQQADRGCGSRARPATVRGLK